MSKIMNIENIEKISVADFLKKYDEAESADDRKVYIMSEIIDKNAYIPYAEKMTYATYILQTAHFKNDKYKHNQSKELFLFQWTIMELYTNLDLHTEEATKEYDLIMGAIKDFKMIEDLASDDIKEFKKVFYCIKRDFFDDINSQKQSQEIIDAIMIGIAKGTEQVLDAVSGVMPEIMEMVNKNAS